MRRAVLPKVAAFVLSTVLLSSSGAVSAGTVTKTFPDLEEHVAMFFKFPLGMTQREFRARVPTAWRLSPPAPREPPQNINARGEVNDGAFAYAFFARGSPYPWIHFYFGRASSFTRSSIVARTKKNSASPTTKLASVLLFGSGLFTAQGINTPTKFNTTRGGMLGKRRLLLMSRISLRYRTRNARLHSSTSCTTNRRNMPLGVSGLSEGPINPRTSLPS